MADLGGTASHLATIKSEGLGYGRYINNFDSLLAALKVDEGLLLNEMTRPIDTAPMDQYGGLLADWLAKQSGHKKRAISRALGNIKEGSGIFERELKELGFVK
ncbi:MAG: hypothetical protein FWH34_06095 [Desulfovibrionaceae bacterium]|nr:hypothetical protein [Desulfovibrionaceae bacterium]